MFTFHAQNKFGAALAALSVLGAVASAAVPVTAQASPAPSYGSTIAVDNSGNCGSITLGATADAASLKAAATCLQQAYQSCQAAQLVATWDTSAETVERLITVSPGDGSCMVVDTVTHTAKASGGDSSDTYLCTKISTDSNGLVVNGCGKDGDVHLAAVVL